MTRRLRQFLIRLTSSATRRRDEQRLREELEDHLALQTDENMRAGLAADEARRQAALKFGAVERIKEDYRDQQGLPWVEHLLQDVRFALRRMRKTPGFTAAAIAMLALGLGLNSAVLSLAYALFLRPLPVDDPSRLVVVEQTFVDDARRGFPLSYSDYLYYRDHAHALDLAAHYSTSPMGVVTPNGPDNVMGAVVTANYFTLLRLQPALGRFFSADEDRVPGRNPVAVLSYKMWRTRFGADPGILGATGRLKINGTAFTVIGIAPEQFNGILTGLEPNQVWIPTAMFGIGYRYCDGFAPGCRVVALLGRLRDSASIDEAQAEMDVLARQLEAAFPQTNKGRGVALRPARGIRIDEQLTDAPIVALLAGAAALVLFIASANVAGLLLARGLRRRKEIAIRLALGATRGRLVRLLLVESVTLAIAGSVVGVIVAIWSTEVLRGFFGVGLAGAFNLDLSLDPRVMVAGIGVAIVTGVVTGIAPALQATRPDPVVAVKEETAGAGARRSTLREALIIVQVALSVVLLGGSGLLVRSFFQLHRGPGFDPDAVVLVRLRPSLVGYTNDRAWAFQRDVIERLEALPWVAAASPAVVPPLPKWGRPVRPIQLAGDSGDASQAFRAATTFVGPRYFKTLGVSVVEGREFDDHDRSDGRRVVLLNETLARHFWPNGGAVGSTLKIGPDHCEVVGVVKDLQWVSALETPDPIAYLSFWQQDRSNSWSQDSRTHIRVSGSAAARLPEIRRTIAAIDPDVPVSEVQPFGASLDYQFTRVRAARTMLVTFGALALVLSMIGLYAALAFAVGQRSREIAVRMALGASRSDVGALVFRRGVAIAAIGLIAGTVAAVALAGPLLASLMYGVSPRDPYALLAGPSMLAVIAMLAIWLPARRAMSQDPVVALRAE